MSTKQTNQPKLSPKQEKQLKLRHKILSNAKEAKKLGNESEYLKLVESSDKILASIFMDL